MRFINTPTMTYADENGVQFSVYEMREIPKYQIAQTIPRNSGEDLDEIYSRQDMAGKGMEGQSYVMHEANISDILDAGFNYDRLRSLKIPTAGQGV